MKFYHLISNGKHKNRFLISIIHEKLRRDVVFNTWQKCTGYSQKANARSRCRIQTKEAVKIDRIKNVEKNRNF